MRLSLKKATADSVSRRLQKYLDMTNILQYPEEELTRFDFFGLRTLPDMYCTKCSGNSIYYYRAPRPISYCLYKRPSKLQHKSMPIFTLISFQPLKSEEAIIQASNVIGFNYKRLINAIVLVKCS